MTINDPATIWRLQLRPKGGEGDPKLAVKVCLTYSVLGMGWPVDAAPGENISWPEYVAR